MLRIFGMAGLDTIGIQQEETSGGQSKEEIIKPVVDALISFREEVRAAMVGSAANVPALRTACDVLR